MAGCLGRSRTVQTVTNGKWADGGSQRAQGFFHIGELSALDARANCSFGTGVVHVRVYERSLTVSEVIANGRSWFDRAS